jgi:hypothetical protein
MSHIIFRNPGDTTLSVFFGASSHMYGTILQTAELHGVPLFFLPNQPNHELQAVDKSIFGPPEQERAAPPHFYTFAARRRANQWALELPWRALIG